MNSDAKTRAMPDAMPDAILNAMLDAVPHANAIPNRSCSMLGSVIDCSCSPS